MYDCNIHRFTEGMQKKRIRSWKDLCDQHMKRMIAIIQGDPDPGVPLSREDRRLLQKGLLLTQQSSFDLNGDGENQRGSMDRLDSGFSENNDLEDDSLTTKAVKFDGLETQNLGDLEGCSTRGQVSDMTAHWNQHAIVGRLHRKTRIPDGQGVLPMLGPRSYFEESYAQTVRQNVREDGIRREIEEAYREELRLNPKLAEEVAAKALHEAKTATSLNSLAGKDKGSVYYVPHGKEVISALRPEDLKRTIMERKEFFYKLIRKKPDADDESITESVG